MTAVALTILSPANGAAFTGAPSVSFKGQAGVPAEISGVPLFYRWYSGLFASVENHYAMNETALNDPSTPVPFLLGVGSHAISLAASDRSGQTKADQNATQHGGVAGGAQTCVVHVFKANLIAPLNTGVYSRATSQLTAEAPLKWGTKPQGSPAFVPDPGYHQINRISYRYVFAPSGAPAGRPIVSFTPTLTDLVFDPSGAPPVVNFKPALSAAVNGAYTLTLFVEDNQPAQHIGAQQVSVNITVTV
jgi:hypothetical protein